MSIEMISLQGLLCCLAFFFAGVSMALWSAIIGIVLGGYQGFYGPGAGMFFMLAYAAFLKLNLFWDSWWNAKAVSDFIQWGDRGCQIGCDFGAAVGKYGSAAQVWSVPSGFQGASLLPGNTQ